MISQLEEIFAVHGRTPKGRNAMRRIFRVLMKGLAQSGVSEVSLASVASAADMSQAALRHYFPTRDDMLFAFFRSGTEWFASQLLTLLARDDLQPREQLRVCVEWHLQFMEAVDTVFWLESSADWIRRSPNRRYRNEFYRSVQREYAALIGKIRPEVGKTERDRRAFAILTLVLGSWITHGKGSSWDGRTGVVIRRNFLLESALSLAES